MWLMTGDTPDQPGAKSPSSAVEAARNAALLERADDWFGDSKALIRAGILRLRLATSNSDNRKEIVDAPELERALNDLTNGLKRAPASAIGWAALAQARLAAGDNPAARAALSTSLLLDDHSQELSSWRCELGLDLWNFLDQDDRRMWNDQVTMVWNEHPDDLVSLARQNDGSYAVAIRLALLMNPAQLSEFDRRFNARR